MENEKEIFESLKKEILSHMSSPNFFRHTRIHKNS